jgi:deoxycytidylate deaminase
MPGHEEIKYPYLPDKKEIFFVLADNFFIQAAKKVCEEKSTDKNHPTGAVVVKDKKIIGAEANQSAFKNPKLVELHKNGFCLRKWLKIKTGTKYWLCPGCSSWRDHAEARAVRDAIKMGNNPAWADLYLYGHWWCCKPCWDCMIKHGIQNVYLLKDSYKMFGRVIKR